jgi:hypothetical protein
MLLSNLYVENRMLGKHSCSVFCNFVLVTLLAISFFMSQFASATSMYKWVDEEGNVQYTQSPPPRDIEYSTLKPPPKIDSERSQNQLEKRKSKVNELREERQKRTADKKTSEEEKTRLKKNCATAKANLASYVMPRVKITAKDGSVIRITEEDRQRRITEAKERVQEFCN